MGLSWSIIWEYFHLAILASLMAGLVCPLVGAFLLLRRTGFYGITLPQFAAAGVAFGFVLLPWWVTHVGIGDLDLETALHDTHSAMNYHLAWAGVFTFCGLALLVMVKSSTGSETGRVAASFAVASAVTILFAHASPTGGEYVHALLRGEILTVGLHEFETLAVVLTLVLLTVVWLHRDLVLVSFDRSSARVLGKRVGLYEALLMALVGLTVTASVLTVGPVVLFGLLVLPPLAARLVASSMVSFLILSSIAGLFAVVGGLWLSFRFDLPLGPSVVVMAAAELLPAYAFGRLRGGALTTS